MAFPSASETGLGLTWTEYKTIRQYHSTGDILNECRTYGYGAGVESMINREVGGGVENGSTWLTEDR